MPEYTLTEALTAAFSGATYKCVLSGSAGGEFRRVELNLIGGAYHAEKLTETQAFHETLTPEEARSLALRLLSGEMRSLNAWDGEYEYSIKITKKGRALYSRRRAQSSPEPKASHDRQKNYLLTEPIAPLVDMGIFTKDGAIAAAMRDKYRQINRFVELIDDEVRKTDKRTLKILDFGCGKSYLTFILYHYFTEIRGLEIQMTGLDLKREVIEKCNAAAQKYGYDGLRFEVGDISGYKPENDIDIVISLHACDTATDFALFNAISWGAELIFSVPCCQHELNAQMKSKSLAILTRYGLVKERFASLLTDSLRCNLLECVGYDVQMIEFVAFEHTPKNIMLRAVKKPGRGSARAKAEIDAAMSEFGVEPTLYRLMRDAGLL